MPHAAEPSVMGSDEKRLVDTVASIPAYAAAFKKAFPDAKGAVTAETLSMAIGAYARKLLTPVALGQVPRRRRERAHATTRRRVSAPSWTRTARPVTRESTSAARRTRSSASPSRGRRATDVGRFDVTKQEVDRFVFKVPTLRNVTKTGPYLHDGSIASLEELTKLMSRHQVGKELTDGQAKSIVTFLGALAGRCAQRTSSEAGAAPFRTEDAEAATEVFSRA